MTDLVHELPIYMVESKKKGCKGMVSVSWRLPLFQCSRGSVTPSGLTCEVREQQTALSVHSGPDTVGIRLWWGSCHSVDSESVGDRVGEGREDTSDDPKPVLDS